MVNLKRVAMRNDFKGPGNRPLLRLSRRDGVFYVPGNQLGYPTAVHPSGTTMPFLANLQGGHWVKGRQAVTEPLPVEHVRGDKQGFGFAESAYRPPMNPISSRVGWYGRRMQAGKCPHCGR